MPNGTHLDADVCRVIEANHIFPDDDTNTILRRLLKIDKTPGGWFSQGVFLPNGTKIRMGYGDDPTLNGEIIDGAWCIRRRKFASPSTAATAFVVRSRGRKNARVNGWNYWHVLKPGQTAWALLDSLRISGNPAVTHNRGGNVTQLHRAGKGPVIRVRLAARP